MGGNYNMGTPGSNIITDHGYGEWVVVLYNPSGPCGLFRGHLLVAKDFHTIYGFRQNSKGEKEKKVLASFPSQNVAFAYDARFIEDIDDCEESEE
jgi:hypothetical protein